MELSGQPSLSARQISALAPGQGSWILSRLSLPLSEQSNWWPKTTGLTEGSLHCSLNKQTKNVTNVTLGFLDSSKSSSPIHGNNTMKSSRNFS